MPGPRATICIVNYKTLRMTRLCLRAIRKFTAVPVDVVVVDNNSADQSLEYLRSLDWIRLIERKAKDPTGGHAHGAALDLGLDMCDTEFFISMHSDTFVHQNGWLSYLLRHFDNNVACVGSGKLELKPIWQQWLQKATDLRTFKRKLVPGPDPLGKYRYYNRTICCLYRTDILKKEGLSFLMGREQGMTIGKKLYFELCQRGYNTVELPASVMSRYLWHLAHASDPMVRSSGPKRAAAKVGKRLQRIMNSDVMKQIEKDESLDR